MKQIELSNSKDGTSEKAIMVKNGHIRFLSAIEAIMTGSLEKPSIFINPDLYENEVTSTIRTLEGNVPEWRLPYDRTSSYRTIALFIADLSDRFRQLTTETLLTATRIINDGGLTNFENIADVGIEELYRGIKGSKKEKMKKFAGISNLNRGFKVLYTDVNNLNLYGDTNQFEKAVTSIFAFAALRPQPGEAKNKTLEYMRMSDKARRDMVNYFHSFSERGFDFSTYEIIDMYHNIFFKLHLGEFLDRSPNPEVQHLNHGIFAEVVTGLYYKGQGAKIEVGTIEEEAMCVDWKVDNEQLNQHLAVQVKSDIKLGDELVFYYPENTDDYQELLKRGAKKRDIDILIEYSREHRRQAVWVFAPGDVKKVLNTQREVKVEYVTT